jgi:YVTN family beta-propeller protein
LSSNSTFYYATRRLPMLSRRRKSFTLLELMIAFVIMAILSAVAIPSLINIANNDRTTADQTSAVAYADASYYGAVSSDSSGSGDAPVNYCDGADQATALPLSSTGLFSISESSAVQVTSACTVSPGYSGTVYYQFGDPVIIAVTVSGTDGGPLPSVDASDSTTTSTSTTTTTVPDDYASVAVGNGPYGVAANGNDVWVTNEDDNTVSEIDATTATVIGSPIAVGSLPQAITDDGTDVWVANVNSETVSEINATTAAVIATIDIPYVDGQPDYPTAISSDGTDVWVAGTGQNNVYEIDIATQSVINTIAVGNQPSAVYSDGTDVWVANSADGTITEIDAATATVVGSPISVGDSAYAVYSNGANVYVALADDSVVVINAATAMVTDTIDVSPGTPLALASDGTDVYAVSSGTQPLEEIQESDNSLTTTANNLYFPYGIAIADGKAWASDIVYNTVTEVPVP